jgi:hypothetical protein
MYRDEDVTELLKLVGDVIDQLDMADVQEAFGINDEGYDEEGVFYPEVVLVKLFDAMTGFKNR